jgi:hypothetical protein
MHHPSPISHTPTVRHLRWSILAEVHGEGGAASVMAEVGRDAREAELEVIQVEVTRVVVATIADAQNIAAGVSPAWS